MNKVQKQVSRARTRVMIGKFFGILVWALFAGLLLSVVGMAIPKIWHLDFLKTQEYHDAWMYSWIIGGTVVGFLVTALLTWSRRDSFLDVAVEVDKRYRLKERLSSALTLDSNTANTSVGQALLNDAEQRAEIIDIRDEFGYRARWQALMPLAPVLLLIGLVFIPNATQQASAVEAEKIEKKKQVDVAVKELKKKLEEKKKQIEAKGLKDSKVMDSLEKQFDKLLDDKSFNKKDALVKLNDIKKQIEDRRKELGDSKDLKQSLNQLKDVKSGPAKDMADALSKGDMKQAAKALKELADKLKQGKLSDIERKKLAKDMADLAKQLKKIAEKHEQEKKKLEDQIKKAIQQGDLDKAAKLQEKLEQKKAQDQQKQQLKKMAEKLQKCADCTNPENGKSGKGKKSGKSGKEQQPGQGGQQNAEQSMKEAGESLEDLAEQIEQMQQQLEELEDLEDLEDMAEGCKNAMNGQAGQNGKPKWNDWAQGEGKGGGKRDKESENTGTFRSRVKGNLQKGETVITGNADGENLTGRSASATRKLIRDSMSQDSDPLENVKLPKSAREHAREYFEQLRKSE